MSKYTLNSSNLFVQAATGDTFYVWDFGGDLNSYFYKPGREAWKVVATVSSKPAAAPSSTQPPPSFTELEVYGTVLSGATLEKLAANLQLLQLFANREGYSVVYFNSDGSKDYKRSSSAWKLNELYDWKYLGVKQETTWMWGRFSMANAGVLIDYKSEVAKKDGDNELLKKQVIEKDEEIAKLKAAAAASGGGDDESLSADGIVAELRNDIEEQNKQLEEAYKELDEVKKQKKDEVAAKDKEIQALKASAGAK